MAKNTQYNRNLLYSNRFTRTYMSASYDDTSATAFPSYDTSVDSFFSPTPIRYAKCPYCGNRQDIEQAGANCIQCNGDVLDDRVS